MRLIQSISVEELALLIAPAGYSVDVVGKVANTSHLNFTYKGLDSSVWLYGLDANGRSSAITFQSSIKCPINSGK